MVGQAAVPCYFCSRGDQTLEVLRAHVQAAAVDGKEDLLRLKRRLRLLEETAALHSCAA